MPAINEIKTRLTLRAAVAIAVYQLLTINTDGEFAVCGATDIPIAQALDDYDADALAGGRLPADGVLELKAAGTIAAIGTPVYTAAAGEVSATAANGARLVGFALKAAADHDIIPVIPFALLVGKPDLAAATYVAPAGGATVDTEARAALAQLAADFADLRAKLIASNLATT